MHTPSAILNDQSVQLIRKGLDAEQQFMVCEIPISVRVVRKITGRSVVDVKGNISGRYNRPIVGDMTQYSVDVYCRA